MYQQMSLIQFTSLRSEARAYQLERANCEVQSLQPSVWRILKDKLQVISYKLQILQILTDLDKEKCNHVCRTKQHFLKLTMALIN